MTENDKMRVALDLASKEHGYDSWNNVLKIMINRQDASLGMYTMHDVVTSAMRYYNETFNNKEK